MIPMIPIKKKKSSTRKKQKIVAEEDEEDEDEEKLEKKRKFENVDADASGLFGSDSEDDEEAEPVKAEPAKKKTKKKPKSDEEDEDEEESMKKSKPKHRKAGSGDEYDSGEEVTTTKEDEDFIDGEDDLADVLGEYQQDKQSFNDERPQGLQVDVVEREEIDEFEESLKSSKGRRRKSKLSLQPQELEQLAQELLYKMDKAWADDQQLVAERKPALEKLKFVDKAVAILRKVGMQQTLLDFDALGIIKKWIEPNEKGKLPNLGLRSKMLRVVQKMPICKEHLKRSGFGKVIMALWKHPDEISENKEICRLLVDNWSRSVFSKTLDYTKLEEFDAEKFDSGRYRRPSARKSPKQRNSRRSDAFGASGESNEQSEGADRVKIPQQMSLDFVHRPQPKVDLRNRPSTKMNPDSKKGKLSKRMQDISRPLKKNVRAIPLSIEGRDT